MSRAVLGVVVSFIMLSVVHAEQPVHFGDARIKAAVEAELWITDPTPSDMLGLVSLYVGDKQISDITGLEYATNLQTLRLPCNWIHDFSPLSGLVSLQTLVINNNSIGGLSALSGLHNLRYLDAHDSLVKDISGLTGLDKLETLILRGNRISSISALSGLTHVRELILMTNQIGDISPLLGLTSLTHLDLRDNPLSEESYQVYVPQIAANNPGVNIQHDRGHFHLVISAGPGGSVTSPGEGDFTCDDGKPVFVEAKADPGFAFVNFSGTFTTTSNPFSLLLGQDHLIRANFVSVSDTLYVDDDAPGDPGPGDAKVSDRYENGTQEHPFDQIQEAIDVAQGHVTIFVQPGIYRESIELLNKSVRLIGMEAGDPCDAAWPLIEGVSGKPIVSFTGCKDPNCLVSGFVLMDGVSRLAGGIWCSDSSPTISNCLVAGNRATDWNGAAVVCTNSHAMFIHCTMADNCAGQFGAALRLVNSQVTIINSILWGDAPKEIQVEGDDMPSIRYSLVAGGWAGTGNLKDDPLFVRRGCWVDRDHPGTLVAPSNPNAVWVTGDYHLQSQAGRWDPIAGQWVQDMATSPCIDAGDQDSPIGKELPPNGGVVDIGVYGGTVEASRSIVPPAP